MHGVQRFFTGQAGVFDLRKLVTAIVNHLGGVHDEAVFLGELEQFGTGVRVRQRDLNRFDVEFLGKLDGLLDGLAGLAWQADDEITMDRQTQLLSVAREVACALDGRALLDVLQDLGIARLIPDDQQTATCFLLCFERLVVRGHARGAAPGHIERLELGAQLDRAGLLNVEGVVVEEYFAEIWPVFLYLGHLQGYAIGGALAPRMPTEQLRPQTEGALCRAATRCIEREVRIEQERNVVLADVEVALVNVDHVGKGIQVLDRWTIWIVNALSVFQVRNSRDVGQQLPIRKLYRREVKFPAHDEVNGRAVS